MKSGLFKDEEKEQKKFISIITHILKKAEKENLLEHKMWLLVQAYLLINYCNRKNYTLSDYIYKYTTTIYGELCQFYKCNSLNALNENLANDIGKQMNYVYQGEKTTYFDEATRVKFLSAIDTQGRIIRDIDKKPAELASNSEIEPLYAFGFDGCLYLNFPDILQKSVASVNNVYKIHHSSFFAGESLVCAGTMIIKEGKLSNIVNDSGHYHPNYRNILLMLQHLNFSGCDLSKTKIKILGKNETLEAYANVFLQEGATLSFCSNSMVAAEKSYHEDMQRKSYVSDLKSDYNREFFNLFEMILEKNLHAEGSSNLLKSFFIDNVAQLLLGTISPTLQDDETTLLKTGIFFKEVSIYTKKFKLDYAEISNEIILKLKNENNIDLTEALSAVAPTYDISRYVPMMNIDYELRLLQLQEYISHYPFNKGKSFFSKYKEVTVHSQDKSVIKVLPEFAIKMLNIMKDPKLLDEEKVNQIITYGISLAKDTKFLKTSSEEDKEFLGLFKSNNLFVTLNNFEMNKFNEPTTSTSVQK